MTYRLALHCSPHTDYLSSVLAVNPGSYREGFVAKLCSFVKIDRPKPLADALNYRSIHSPSAASSLGSPPLHDYSTGIGQSASLAESKAPQPAQFYWIFVVGEEGLEPPTRGL